MYIFYDFETSSRELLGQILSYAFIVTDKDLTVVDELTGFIKLNRIQLPEVEAILTNRIQLSELEDIGDFEYVAAEKIYSFLLKIQQENPYTALVGYNSNSFDINFLRNLLIQYGYNPYFDGKLTNVDVLHFVQHVAFENVDQFPFVLKDNKEGVPYYSFRLEDITKALEILEGAQVHSAIEDVKLLIVLVQKLEATFNMKLSDFRPIQLPVNASFDESLVFAKQKVRDFSDGDDLPEKVTYKYWYRLLATKKHALLIDLEKYQQVIDQSSSDLTEQDLLGCVKYVNYNKQFMVLEPCVQNDEQYWQPILSQLADTSFFKTLTSDKYFKLIEKKWDIAYQIHVMGFDHIPKLGVLVKGLLDDPSSYMTQLKALLASRKTDKDTYLIQLFNRAYLNFHPDVKLDHIKKYIEPRYITGAMLRNPDEFESLGSKIIKMQDMMASDDYSEEDKMLIYEVLECYQAFCTQNQIEIGVVV